MFLFLETRHYNHYDVDFYGSGPKEYRWSISGIIISDVYCDIELAWDVARRFIDLFDEERSV